MDIERFGDYMKGFEELLDISTKNHGHLCAGQVIGVRMSMLGLDLIGISDPRGAERKQLYVIVEIDRCATDAIQSVTGCSLGKRSLKWLDHGVMAATFVHLSTGKAIRITAKDEARFIADSYAPEIKDKYQRQLQAYKSMRTEDLFKIEQVSLSIPAEDLPGKPLGRIQCSGCGDWVQDRREREKNGLPYCLSCFKGRYYQVID